MKKTLFFLIATSVIILISSCSDTSLLSPTNSTGVSVDIQSVKDGDFLKPGNSVTFKVLYPPSEEQADGTVSLSISLENLETGEVNNKTVESPLFNEPMELDLGELESGQYRLTIDVLRDGATISESSTTFFYVSGNYKVTDIQSFPPVIFPEAEVHLEALLDIPEGSDPYLRWTRDGSLIAKGSLSEGLNSITIDAPKKPGVYSIKVELFPYKPVEGEDFNFASPVYLTSEMYVSQREHETSYYSRIFFTSEPVDYGSAAKLSGTSSPASDTANSGGEEGDAATVSEGGGGITKIGNPLPPEEGRQTGYTLEKGSGFKLNYGIIPVSGGKYQPFTITFDLSGVRQEKNASLVTVYENDPDSQSSKSIIRVFFGEDGTPSVSLLGSDMKIMTLISGIGMIPEGDNFKLSLSFLPEDSYYRIIWFVDGEQKAAGNITGQAYEPTGQLYSVIGGDDGFSGTIHEIKVYYKDQSGRNSVDSNILANSLKEEYGNRLILAEGFDGTLEPKNFELSGDWRIEPGFMVLNPDSSLKSPPIEIKQGDTTISLGFKLEAASASASEDQTVEKAGINLFLVDEDTGKELFSVSFKEKSNIKLLLHRDEGGNIYLTDSTSGAPSDSVEGEPVLLKEAEKNSPVDLSVKISNDKGGDSVLLLDYITVTEEE